MNCSHCSREVRSTIHSKNYAEGFRVDYYRLVTGDLQYKEIQNPTDESQKIEYLKLENPRTVITCIDCLSNPDIQAELNQAFSGMPARKGRS